MKGKVYKVATKLMYDVYSLGWKLKDVKRGERTNHDDYKPIFAHSEEEAIEKYKKRYDWENAKPWWEFDLEVRNLMTTVEIVSRKNNYTFNQLKEEMNSQDFLEYCRQELLGVEEVVN